MISSDFSRNVSFRSFDNTRTLVESFMQFIDFHIVLTLCKKIHILYRMTKNFCLHLGMFWCVFLGFYAHEHQGSSTERARTCKSSGIELFEHLKIWTERADIRACSVFGTPLEPMKKHSYISCSFITVSDAVIFIRVRELKQFLRHTML